MVGEKAEEKAGIAPHDLVSLGLLLLYFIIIFFLLIYT